MPEHDLHSTYLGQHTTPVSPGPRASTKMFGIGLIITASDLGVAVVELVRVPGPKIPVRAIEPLEYLTATPAVVHDAGQTMPGE